MTRRAQRGLLLLLIGTACAHAQQFDPPRFDIGVPTLTNIWVDPVHGSDAASGATSNTAVRTLDEAWNRIPAGTTLAATGYRILLTPGDYPAGTIPLWWANRHGTLTCPIVLQAAAGRGTSRLHEWVNMSDCRFLYFLDVDIVTDPDYGGGGNALHLEACDHILLHGCRLDGWDGDSRNCAETLKANQTQHLYVEECEIKSARYPVDFMVVQYGHIVRCRIHDAEDWCCLIKGGSAYLRVEGNEIFDGATGGLTIGDSCGFNYMTSPWLHYDACDIKVVNNVIHHTGIAGMGVHGGYNVLLAHNTLYRAGVNDHLIEIRHGDHVCAEDYAICVSNRAAGAWGRLTGGDAAFVPCRNVYVYNNLIYNPSNSFQGWSHLVVEDPVTPPACSNMPNPSRVDDNLQIRGNLIWSGDTGTPLGIEGTGACAGGNTNCNEVQLWAGNTINRFVPQLRNPEAGDFRPVPCGNVFTSRTYAIPPFPGGDRVQPPLAPAGRLDNTVPREGNESPRYGSGPPGAFTGGGSVAFRAIARAEGLARISLRAETGHHYRVESSPDLVAWNALAETNSAAATNDFLVAATGAVRHLRARLLP